MQCSPFVEFSYEKIKYDHGDNFNVILFRIKDFLNSSPETRKPHKQSCPQCNFFRSSELAFCNFCLGNKSFETNVEFYNSVQPKISKATQSPTKLFVFCLDISGSMCGQRIETVKLACLQTVKSIQSRKLNDQYNIALISFSDNAIYYDLHTGNSQTLPNCFSQSLCSINDYQLRIRTISQSRTNVPFDLEKKINNFQIVEKTFTSLNGNGGNMYKYCFILFDFIGWTYAWFGHYSLH